MNPMRDPRDDSEESRPEAPAGLFFSRRGNWFHDGDRIFHAGLSGLLDRSVARADEGDLVVTTGRDVMTFACEDAPVMVREVHEVEGELVMHLSTGVDERLPGTIAVGSDHRLRVPVMGGRLWALLGRAAGHTLEPRLEQDDDGTMWISHGRRRHAVIPIDTDWRQLPTLSVDVGAGVVVQ